jgi:predicted nuclease of restriction endonuclease-like (RecB) superfamily
MAIEEFKNAYSLEFLSLQEGRSEADLHGALLRNLGRFITELGRDFCFVGSEYPVQVGNHSGVRHRHSGTGLDNPAWVSV